MFAVVPGFFIPRIVAASTYVSLVQPSGFKIYGQNKSCNSLLISVSFLRVGDSRLGVSEKQDS